MGVDHGGGYHVLRPEAMQNSLEDGVGVAREAPNGGAHGVDGAASGIVKNTADGPQELVRRVVSAVDFALLGCGCHAVGMSFLELVAAGGEERLELGVMFPSLRCAGVL